MRFAGALDVDPRRRWVYLAFLVLVAIPPPPAVRLTSVSRPEPTPSVPSCSAGPGPREVRDLLARDELLRRYDRDYDVITAEVLDEARDTAGPRRRPGAQAHGGPRCWPASAGRTPTGST